MLFTNFSLEDEFNKSEGLASICLGSAAPIAKSISELLDYYHESEKIQILKGLMDLKLDYSSQFGSLELRRRLAKKYSGKDSVINAEDIITTSGASEAIFIVFSSLFEAGDTIVVQEPIYQSLYQIALDMGVNVLNWEYDFTRDFEFNIENLKTIFTKNQRKRSKIKALVLNNPNNPTGITFDKDQMNTIASLCEIFGQNRDLYLISDEVFHDIKWDDSKEIVSAVNVYDKSIVISDLSKSYGFAGLRLGWIVANKELVARFSSQKNYLSLRSNTLSEYLAQFVLEKGEEITQEIIQNVEENLEYLFSLDTETLPFDIETACTVKFNRGRSFLMGQAYGGLCIFPKVKDEYLDFFSEDNLKNILKEHGLFIVSGQHFGEAYKEHIRIGLGLEPEKFKAAMSMLLIMIARKNLVTV